MRLRFFNTLTKGIEPFEKTKGDVLLYSCGPTVYDFAHIGNLRTFLFEDLLRRTLVYAGFSVQQVMNLTDVDDKTIRASKDKGVSLREYTDFYIERFLSDLTTLRCKKVEFHPRATDHIDRMVEMIEDLLKKEMAYRTSDGSIYFRVASFQRYGMLSGRRLEEQLCLEEGEGSEEKESPADFALWKAYFPLTDGEVYWETSLGKGRPGWHIECSAMAYDLLGPSIDIHCGGVDLCFPHHENEIAQSEAYTGKPLARFWMHGEHLMIEGKKMSKSLKNLYTLQDVLDRGFTARDLRMFFLQAHYRMPLNFTFDGLTASRNALERIDAFLARLSRADGKSSGFDPLLNYVNRCKDSLADDLDTPCFFATLFEWIREANRWMDEGKLAKEDAMKIRDAFFSLDAILGLFVVNTSSIPKEILELAHQREQARLERNFEQADVLRNELQGLGYTIEDYPDGSYKLRSRYAKE